MDPPSLSSSASQPKIVVHVDEEVAVAVVILVPSEIVTPKLVNVLRNSAVSVLQSLGWSLG